MTKPTEKGRVAITEQPITVAITEQSIEKGRVAITEQPIKVAITEQSIEKGRVAITEQPIKVAITEQSIEKGREHKGSQVGHDEKGQKHTVGQVGYPHDQTSPGSRHRRDTKGGYSNAERKRMESIVPDDVLVE
jgi:hypothetical protein